MSVFTDWKDRKMTTIWVGKKFEVGETPPKKEETFFGAPHITTPSKHMIPTEDPTNCVTVGPGSWKNKIIHFLPEGQPSASGNEI